ncbi:heterogeneous nuclear ribonucleoprotein 1-like [Chenopodium quinoa]|uniref:heterogeneous nuclear ribonucleoprotein 1-like n=1 Tax=Chenopodium quinoa TaxID=63459 RepID=UPI000B784574|nr:heterogeneous nuclear ribonucleoprotein 1-like [Chenopodium quinoa]
MEPGKLFIGGISWDTNEDRLREYFQTFGEVVEAVIMKDRATGRARGFGFVIYADPVVAERVVRQKHMIDGRTVEAKKAVPRDDQHVLTRNHNSPSASPVPTRTKKIFVGGLPSTVTEGDFKRYFDQFGIITDVVVMYDHNTQRPRGFGFITFDSEDAVERALMKTFHELNGKMVEVKRAVPKELSPGPTRSPLGGGSGGLTRVNSFLNGYTQGYNPSPIGGHGLKIDERQSPMPFARGGFPSFSPSSYGSALNYEPRMSPGFGETANLFPKLNFEQGLSALHNGNINRHDSFAEFDGVNRGSASTIGSSSWSLWGNGNGNGSIIDTSITGNNASMNFRDIEADALKNSEFIWNTSAIPVQGGGRASVSNGLSLSYGREDNNLGSAMGLYGRDIRTRTQPVSSFPSLDGGFDAKFDDFLGGGNEQSLLLPSLGLKGSGSFEFGLGNSVSDVPLNNPAGLCW